MAVFTGAPKPTQNVSILDFCNNTQVTTALLTPTADKNPANRFLQPLDQAAPNRARSGLDGDAST